ncbi:uncharacterized protein PHACADRAFT_259793 [Phanerochaete carnosa HHB-10118-sp]|uniref:FAD dependent oxidoreductase domain-containing protein n=1 Tax=Phanerochaete carnosa (strain HHB-10118-sp) TaxID=650164 RepID=K5W3C7_PHACS|nr:uncharacterized protein PHACADRAFT_259793 [Phanerochaete carnosa HHB-10118-sp]EKM53419.1 hypothetical protein PHACADRAFT_259793 [Phanerochaete carnosa HHB-10118-sp]
MQARNQEAEYTRTVVIVGAGVFGLSTALHLLQRGYSVTVLERASEVPAQDAAGYDLNKVVRSSYADPFYTEFAREAIDLWRKEEWEGCYHECGVFMPLATGSLYSKEAYENDVAAGARISEVRSFDDLKKVFPVDVATGFDSQSSEAELSGFLNHEGGWAESGRALEILLERVRAAGAQVIAGKEVSEVLREGAASDSQAPLHVTGVKCTDGSEYHAAVVIVAAGAWTPRLVQRLGVEFAGPGTQKSEYEPTRHVGVGLATGQVVATIQLTQEEADRYHSVPIVLDYGSGIYMFPPNADNVVKLGYHGNGYLHQPSSSMASTPRTALTDGEDGLRIPKEMVKLFRGSLKRIYPELGKKPFSGTRLCWYNDSPDDDWVIGFHPITQGLLFATAGSGHAFKFLPNIGRLVADALEGKLLPELAARFSLERTMNAHTSSRMGLPIRPLKLEELCDQDDLCAGTA